MKCIKASNTIDKKELPELSKLINNRKVNDIRKHNMQTIQDALTNGGNIKVVKRKLGIGKNKIYVLRDKEGNVITNMDCLVEVTEEVYTDPYRSSNNPDGNDGGGETDELDIPNVTKEEVRKALAAIQREKVAGGTR